MFSNLFRIDIVVIAGIIHRENFLNSMIIYMNFNSNDFQLKLNMYY